MRRAPQIGLLADGRRLHLQDGPIDLIVEARGSETGVAAAYQAAARRFTGLLDELCAELPMLREAADPARCPLQGTVARRMHAAVAPFAAEHFITPMAAVAGAVAEEILGAMVRSASLARAYVNNGGDIALHLADGEHFTVGLIDRPDARGLMRTTSHRQRRSLARGCDQWPPRPKLLARHCRRRHRAGADRVASRCRRHHHRQCRGFAGTSGHHPLPGAGSAARQRSWRAPGDPRRRCVVGSRDCRRARRRRGLRPPLAGEAVDRRPRHCGCRARPSLSRCKISMRRRATSLSKGCCMPDGCWRVREKGGKR